MKERIPILIVSLFCAVLLVGCQCEHEWQEATCEIPRTCVKCEETEGEPLGHTWEDATCEAPKTCMICGSTEGTVLGHTWKNATCEIPKTCTMCAKTEGTALSHTPGNSEVAETDILAGQVVLNTYCANCKEMIQTETTNSFIYGDSFCFTRKEFLDRFAHTASEVFPDFSVIEYDDGETAFTFSKTNQVPYVPFVYCYVGRSLVNQSIDTRYISQVMIRNYNYIGIDAATVEDIMPTEILGIFLKSCDPASDDSHVSKFQRSLEMVFSTASKDLGYVSGIIMSNGISYRYEFIYLDDYGATLLDLYAEPI